jgi:GIY-YIG catalytic domain
MGSFDCVIVRCANDNFAQDDSVMSSYFVYIVCSRSGTLYIGLCNNIERRMWEHKSGKFEGFASKYH